MSLSDENWALVQRDTKTALPAHNNGAYVAEQWPITVERLLNAARAEERDKAQAEIERLKEALRPFAERAAEGRGGAPLSAYRNAAALLSKDPA